MARTKTADKPDIDFEALAANLEEAPAITRVRARTAGPSPFQPGVLHSFESSVAVETGSVQNQHVKVVEALIRQAANELTEEGVNTPTGLGVAIQIVHEDGAAFDAKLKAAEQPVGTSRVRFMARSRKQYKPREATSE